MFGEDVLWRHSVSQHRHNTRHRKAHAADARHTTHYFRVDCYAGEFHRSILGRTTSGNALGSAPGEHRLLQVGDRSVPAVQHQLPELIQHGGGGRVEVAAEQR